ncbi:MAG: glycosyltransferase family 4 protein [Clostridiaceae bacterium]
MKVILLAPTPPPAGGIASWTVRMQNANLKNGWKVEVVDEKLIGNREVFGSAKKIQIYTEMKRCISIWKNLCKSLEDKDAKVVHSCIPAGTTGMLRELICAIITKTKKRKFIIHYRCTLENMVKSKLGNIIFRILTNKSDLVIALNKSSLEFINKYSKIPVLLIPNFIEESMIRNENTKIISESIKRVVYVGGVIESKGCYDIIKVASEFPEVEFHLVGKAESNIIKMNKPRNVILSGELRKEEVKLEFEKADIFIFLTCFPGEGFSNALVEAMANGLPCIVTDWAANHDMIEEHGGIVVRTKDVPAVVEAIKNLDSDKNIRKEQSNWNIRKVKENYIDTIVTNMYVDAYEWVIK